MDNFTTIETETLADIIPTPTVPDPSNATLGEQALTPTADPTGGDPLQEAWDGAGEGAGELESMEDMFPFLDTDPYHAIPYIAVLSVTLIVGIFGNSLIIRAMMISKKLKTLGNEYIVNLAISDLCVTMIAEPVCLLGVIKGKTFFLKNPWLCQLMACFCLSACLCSFLNLMALTFNRYLFITHNQFYMRLVNRARIIVSCVLIWALAFLLEMPNFLGWGGHYFDEKQLQCIWNRTASYSYTLFLTVGLIGFPLLFMMAAYINIFVYIYKTKTTLLKHHPDKEAASVQELWKQQWAEILRSCQTLLLVVVMYIVCWLPYVLVVTIDHHDRLPLWTHLWATYLAHLHSSLNFLIYAANSRDMRRAFAMALGCGGKDREGKYLYPHSGSGPKKDTGTSSVRSDDDKKVEEYGKDSYEEGKDSFDCHM